MTPLEAVALIKVLRERRKGIDITIGPDRHTHRHHHADAQRRRVVWMYDQQMFGAIVGGLAATQLQNVSTNSGTNAVGSITATFGKTQVGTTLVMLIATANGAGAATITMSAGWTQGPHVHPADASHTGVEIWYYKNNPGAITSATVTLSTNNQAVALVFFEYGGLNQTAPLDTSGTNNGNSSAASVTTAANIIAGTDFSVAMVCAPVSSGIQSFSGGSALGWNIQGQIINGANQADSVVQTNQAARAGGTLTLNSNLGQSVPWSAAIAAFKQ